MNHHAIDHLLAFAFESPWAVTPVMLRLVANILADRLAGIRPDAATLAALVDRRQLPQPKRGGTVAIVPVHGVLAPRINLVSEMSGGTTFQAIERELAAAVADPEITTIVLDIDSPGGNIAGATEAHRALMKARTQKPVIAHIHPLGASAAYWFASGATKVIASPSAFAGAIGVYLAYDEITAALEQRGIKREVISAGKYKGEGLGGPLSAEARAHYQRNVGAAYNQMTTDIANGRGVKVGAVRDGFGEGLCLNAADALEAGLVDEVLPLEDVLARLGVSTLAALPFTAATDQEPIAATSQELAANAVWMNAALGELLALDL